MNAKKLVVLFAVVISLSAVAAIYAAESSSFVLTMFTAGLQGSPANSSLYQARSLLAPFQPGSGMAQSTSFSASVGFFSSTQASASIDAYDVYPRSSTPGSIIRLYISASNALSVWAALALPNGSSERLELVNNGNAYYVASLAGRYDIVFYANNSAGSEVNATDYFTTSVTSTPPAAVPAGGEAVYTNCTYMWECSPWSICFNGKQTRTCVNTGTCTGDKEKPEEKRDCSEALFDVLIKLDNIELTENETLSFDVNLTEKNLVEKIDVQVTYTILNENATEIFRQMETKAVEKNLSYKKTIDEIKLGEGRYTLKVGILYGFQQKAYAEQSFFVRGGAIIIILPEERPEAGLFTVLVIVVITLTGLLIIAAMLLAGRGKRARKPARKTKAKPRKKLRKGDTKRKPKMKKAAKRRKRAAIGKARKK